MRKINEASFWPQSAENLFNSKIQTPKKLYSSSAVKEYSGEII